jgi:hypothetical protein
VKACKNTTFSLLYMSGQPHNYWCFALMHGCGLLNMHPFSDGHEPSGLNNGLVVLSTSLTVEFSDLVPMLLFNARLGPILILPFAPILAFISVFKALLALCSFRMITNAYVMPITLSSTRSSVISPWINGAPLVAFCAVKLLTPVLLTCAATSAYWRMKGDQMGNVEALNLRLPLSVEHLNAMNHWLGMVSGAEEDGVVVPSILAVRDDYWV